MILSRQNSETSLPAPLLISGKKIEHKHETSFLGVIVDENLTLPRHISTLRSKMAEYIGIMYKLKRFLPLKTRIQIYHSFFSRILLTTASLGWLSSLSSEYTSVTEYSLGYPGTHAHFTHIMGRFHGHHLAFPKS